MVGLENNAGTFPSDGEFPAGFCRYLENKRTADSELESGKASSAYEEASVDLPCLKRDGRSAVSQDGEDLESGKVEAVW